MDVTTFGAFTTARLGIYASQKALEVTGHNISNINTTGYTRQKVDQVSLRVGATNHYASAYGGATGSGTLITGMSQFRDPYLDIRYRTENANVGAMDTKLNGLQELSSILDEVGTGSAGNEGEGILAAQFQDLRNQLAKLTGDQTTEEEFLTLVRTSADSLVKLLNNFSKRIDEVRDNQIGRLTDDVAEVNDILANIRTLNESILKQEMFGDSALELRDQRNLLIDDLSQYIKIDVSYSPVQIGAGKSVDKLVIKTSGDPPVTLVDGDYTGKLTMASAKAKNPDYDPTAAATGTNLPYLDAAGNPAAEADAAEVPYTFTISELTNRNGQVLNEGKADESQPHEFGDTELYGALQASRELLTEEGEFTSGAMDKLDSSSATKRGIPYYQKALDALAQKIATVFNGANTGYLRDSEGYYVDANGDQIQFTLDAAAGTTGPLKYTDTLTADQQAELEAGGVSAGGVLFSNGSKGDDTAGITAANISISKSWSVDPSVLQNSFETLAGTAKVGSSDNQNIIHILALFDGKQDYYPSEVAADAANGTVRFFRGSFEEMFTNIEETLAQDVKSTETLLNNYDVTATELDVSRESFSGVDLNDEAMNLMQFQKSYSAACRLMTTLDQVLDKLINGTGVVGL